MTANAVALTKQRIDAAQPQASAYRLWDAKVPGLCLRVTPAGAKTWAVRWNRQSYEKLGRYPAVTLEAARHRALQVLAEVAKHGEPAQPKHDENITFGAALDLYAAAIAVDLKAPAAPIAAMRVHFATWTRKPLRSITLALVNEFKAERKAAGIRIGTINRELTRIRAMLGWAFREGLLSEHPLKGLRLLKGANSRDRHLSDAEEQALRQALVDRDAHNREKRRSGNAWRAARGHAVMREWADDEYTDHLHPMVLLALNTGLRRGELFSLRWCDLNFDARTLRVDAGAAKTQRQRHGRLNSEALAVLTKWRRTCPESPKGYVFPGPGGARMTNVNRSWESLMEAAGLDDMRFHDLRHSFASSLVAAGVHMRAVQTLMGHSDARMTERYAHLAPGYLDEAVETLAQRPQQAEQAPAAARAALTAALAGGGLADDVQAKLEAALAALDGSDVLPRNVVRLRQRGA